MSAETGRTFELLLLEDFGRAGTQSLVIDRLGSGGELSWGATYIGDVIRLAPDAIAPTPDDDKVAAGTELLNGAGSYAVGERSSRIYGLAGEGMINFGLVGGIVAFLPFAVLVRWADRYWSDSLAPDDPSAKLLAAWLPATVIVALASDLDNVLWMLIKQAMVMILVVFFARTRATERDG
ncbi:hypothetical protein GCM10022236_06430 [Microlunatus ginsengisoli]|uniref:Uncharacterized protein n=2 Tax=Microlunatus ginsengisoli TaxID=363863 RepID=A0ABP6ZER6_9ACTN